MLRDFGPAAFLASYAIRATDTAILSFKITRKGFAPFEPTIVYTKLPSFAFIAFLENPFAGLLGVKPKRLRVRDQARRWGSCSEDGDVALNWRIVMAPASAVDYVVAHELAHLVQRDHGPRFWRMLASVLPDYEDRREWLRLHGPELDL